MIQSAYSISLFFKKWFNQPKFISFTKYQKTHFIQVSKRMSVKFICQYIDKLANTNKVDSIISILEKRDNIICLHLWMYAEESSDKEIKTKISKRRDIKGKI